MRLLYLTRSYTGHDTRWLRVLSGQGLRVAFLPVQRVDEMRVSRELPGVELLSSPGLTAEADTAVLDAAVPVVRQQVQAWLPDVILAGPLTDAGYLATAVAPDKTLLMSWAFDLLHEPKLHPEIALRLKKTLALGRHLFTDCEPLLRQAESLAGRPFHNTCVLPWGLDAEDKPAPQLGWRKRLGDERAGVVLCVRGFAPVHCPELALEAFRLAFARNENLRLWLAGAGALQERVGRVVDGMGLRSAVRMLGQLDQPALAGCFAESDVYLSCADSDGSSLSLLQAMHAGLPCVATDLPGNREWLEPGGGWLARAGQAESFARALGEAGSLSPAVRAEMAARNRITVAGRADLAANLPRLLRTLSAVAGLSAGHRQLVAV